MKYEKIITIIGAGPRGISVLDRLIENFKNEEIKIKIHIFDRFKVGGGKVWDTNQNENLLMNTLPEELTIFSETNKAMPGKSNIEKLTFKQWIEKNKKNIDSKLYQPRRFYGEYLKYAFNQLASSKIDLINIISSESEVYDIEKYDSGFMIKSGVGDFYSDCVVLATGHEYNNTYGLNEELKKLSSEYSLNYYPDGYIADYDLSLIPKKSSVGVLGLGLNFYDTVSLLTTGRGGKFVRDHNNKLMYQPSGEEPAIIAGSRTGMPSRARAINQKLLSRTPKSYFLRRLANKSNLSFKKEIYPAIEAEVNFNYLINKASLNQDTIDFLVERINSSLDSFSFESLAHVIGVDDFKKIDLRGLYQPFINLDIDNIGSFHELIRRELDFDVKEAKLGNVSSLLKNSIDLLRDLRGDIRKCVEFDKIKPDEFTVFYKEFKPLYSSLVAGPPVNRVEELLALLDAGVVKFIGPNAYYQLDRRKKVFTLHSKDIHDSYFEAKSLIVARTPDIDIKKTNSRLFINLVKRGIIRENIKSSDNINLGTGGVDICKNSLNPIDLHNKLVQNMYVIGIPTEASRFFTQTAGSNPNKWNDIIHDSEIISSKILEDAKEITYNYMKEIQ